MTLSEFDEQLLFGVSHDLILVHLDLDSLLPEVVDYLVLVVHLNHPLERLDRLVSHLLSPVPVNLVLPRLVRK